MNFNHSIKSILFFLIAPVCVFSFNPISADNLSEVESRLLVDFIDQKLKKYDELSNEDLVTLKIVIKKLAHPPFTTERLFIPAQVKIDYRNGQWFDGFDFSLNVTSPLVKLCTFTDYLMSYADCFNEIYRASENCSVAPRASYKQKRLRILELVTYAENELGFKKRFKDF